MWATTNYGTSWTQVTANAAWAPRQSPNVAVSSSGVFVLVGGMAYLNAYLGGAWYWFTDAYVSLDAGATWLLVNPSISSGSIAYSGITVDPRGYVVMSGGLIGPPSFLTSAWGWTNTVANSSLSLNNLQNWLPAFNASYPASSSSSYPCQGSFVPPPPSTLSSSSGGAAVPTTASSSSAAGTQPSVSSSGAVVVPVVLSSSSAVGSTPAGNSSNSGGGSSGLSGGAIAGIVIGSVVGVALILVVCCFLLWNRSDTKASSYATQREHSHVTQSGVTQDGVHTQGESEHSTVPDEVEMQQVEEA